MSTAINRTLPGLLRFRKEFLGPAQLVDPCEVAGAIPRSRLISEFCLPLAAGLQGLSPFVWLQGGHGQSRTLPGLFAALPSRGSLSRFASSCSNAQETAANCGAHPWQYRRDQ